MTSVAEEGVLRRSGQIIYPKSCEDGSGNGLGGGGSDSFR